MIRITQEARGKLHGDGVQLAFGYWPGRGAPVVGLHGITANILNFIGVAERLNGRRPLFALDLRGRGDSDKPPGSYGFAQHGRDVAEAMRSMQLSASIVVGHSMGGFVAAALAAQNPELVAALILVDGGYVFSRSAAVTANEEINAALAERINQLVRTYPSRDAYREFWKTQPNFPPEDWGPWVEAFLNNEVAGPGPVQPKALQSAVMADLMEGPKTDEILARLSSIRVPVIFLRAETGFTRTQPPLYPDSIVEEFRAYIPQVEDQKIEGTTHYTIMLGERGASQIADLIVDLSDRLGV